MKKNKIEAFNWLLDTAYEFIEKVDSARVVIGNGSINYQVMSKGNVEHEAGNALTPLITKHLHPNDCIVVGYDSTHDCYNILTQIEALPKMLMGQVKKGSRIEIIVSYKDDVYLGSIKWYSIKHYETDPISWFDSSLKSRKQ